MASKSCSVASIQLIILIALCYSPKQQRAVILPSPNFSMGRNTIAQLLTLWLRTTKIHNDLMGKMRVNTITASY